MVFLIFRTLKNDELIYKTELIHNELIYKINKLTDLENDGWRGMVEGGTDWEFGMDTYTLIYLK